MQKFKSRETGHNQVRVIADESMQLLYWSNRDFNPYRVPRFLRFWIAADQEQLDQLMKKLRCKNSQLRLLEEQFTTEYVCEHAENDVPSLVFH